VGEGEGEEEGGGRMVCRIGWGGGYLCSFVDGMKMGHSALHSESTGVAMVEMGGKYT